MDHIGNGFVQVCAFTALTVRKFVFGEGVFVKVVNRYVYRIIGECICIAKK